MCSECGNTTLLVLSSLIRTSADHRMFAPPRSFSQLATSFFGAIYQGIPREPFVAWSSTRLFVFQEFSMTFTRFLSLLPVRLQSYLTKFVLTFLYRFFSCLSYFTSLFSCQSAGSPLQRRLFPSKKQAVSSDSLHILARMLFFVKHFSPQIYFFLRLFSQIPSLFLRARAQYYI